MSQLQNKMTEHLKNGSEWLHTTHHARTLGKSVDKASQPMQLKNNAGDKLIDKEGMLNSMGKMWFDEQAMANVLSFVKTRECPRNFIRHNAIVMNLWSHTDCPRGRCCSKESMDTMLTNPTQMKGKGNCFELPKSRISLISIAKRTCFKAASQILS